MNTSSEYVAPVRRSTARACACRGKSQTETDGLKRSAERTALQTARRVLTERDLGLGCVGGAAGKNDPYGSRHEERVREPRQIDGDGCRRIGRSVTRGVRRAMTIRSRAVTGSRAP